MFIFSNCPFALVPIFPSAHLPQIFIFPKSQFAPSPHLLRCLFVIYPVPICPKCPFASSVDLLQILHIPKYPLVSVPTCHSAHHFPKSYFPRCPFAPNAHLSQVPNCPKPECLRPIFPGPKCTGSNYPGPFILVLICRGPKCTGINCPRPICLVPICPDARLSWCPFVWDPFFRDPNVRKEASTPHIYI